MIDHGIAAGRYKIPLIGGDRPSQGVIERLLRWTPEKVRSVTNQLRNAQRADSLKKPAKRGVGGWVTDMAELKQCLLFCWACEPKWRPSAASYGYFRDTRWDVDNTCGVGGKCDGCGNAEPMRLQFYVHESYVGVSYKPRNWEER